MNLNAFLNVHQRGAGANLNAFYMLFSFERSFYTFMWENHEIAR